MKKILLLIFLLLTVFVLYSQEYRTRSSGNWTDIGVWQQCNKSGNSCNWVNYSGSMPTTFPQNQNGLIFIIRTGHTIILNSNLIIDGNKLTIIIENGGQFIIPEGVSLIIDGNSGTLEINGNLTVDGLIDFNGNGGQLTGSGTLSGTGTIEGNFTTSGQINNSLPIELKYFKSKIDNGVIKLEWVTLTEINNDYFTIEKSVNGIQWEILSYVNGAGNSNNSIKYEYFDINPTEGVSYYRLTQTDYDGKFEIFNPISVYWSNNQLIYVKIYDLMGYLLYEENIFNVNHWVIPKLNIPIIVIYMNQNETEIILTKKIF